MDKKNSIIISVLINASLLVVLFIAALSKEEKKVLPSSPDFVQSEMTKEMESLHPLFEKELKQETKEIAFETIKEIEVAPVEQKPLVKEEEKENTVVYKLPQLDQNSPEQKKENTVSLAQNTIPLMEIRVQKGDSLEKLAKRYGSSVSELKKMNQLDSNLLKIGKGLLVPAKKKSNGKMIANNTLVNEGEFYIVKRGDNPWTIAMKHHLKVEELLRLNNLNQEKARRLRPGDKLRIR